MQYAVLLCQLFMKRQLDFHQTVFDAAYLRTDCLHHTLPRKACFYPLTKIAGIRDLHWLTCLLLSSPQTDMACGGGQGKCRRSN
ncbi:hypothetical protein D3C80_1500130 [compost metagenome]